MVMRAGGGPLENVRPNAMHNAVRGLSSNSGSVNHAAPLCQPARLLRSRGSPISTPIVISTVMAMVEAITSHS